MLPARVMARKRLILENFLPYRLSFTANLVSQAIAVSYGPPLDLSVPEWRVLAVIAESDGITQAEIALRTMMDKVTVSRAAIGLRHREWIASSPNPHDKRSHLLMLTQAGRESYEAIAPKALDLEQRLFAALDPEDLRVLTQTLRKIDTALLARRRDG